MEKIDIFDKYFKKLMTVEENFEFEKGLSQNSDLKNEFSKYKLAVELLKFDNLKKEISSVHQEFSHPQAKVIKFPIMRIAAALIFGFLVYGGFWFINNDGVQMLDSQSLSYIEPQQRGDVEEKAQAELYYINGQFEQLFDLYKSSKNSNQKLTFLAAMAYFKQKNYQKSLALIEELQLKKTNPEFNNELEYYKGQSLVGLNRINEALDVFKKMGKNNPYSAAIDWKYLLKLKILKLKY